MHFNTKISSATNWGMSLHYTPGSGFFEEYKADQNHTDYGFTPVITSSDTINQTDLIRRRWLDNHFYGLVTSFQHRWRDGLDLMLGGGWNHYSGRHFGEVIWAEYAYGLEPENIYYDNEADKFDANIYGKITAQLNDRISALVDIQYRNIIYQFLGPDTDGQLTDQEDRLNFFNPKIGLDFHFNDKLNLFLHSGIAQKEPNRNDYVESSPLTRPKPEWLWNTELGAKWRPMQNLELFPNLYYMHYRDQLALTGELNDVGAASRTNVDRSYRAGLELGVQYSPASRFTINGNMTISQNKIQSLDQFVDRFDSDFNYIDQVIVELTDTDLSFSPKFVGHLGGVWSLIQNESFGLQCTANLKMVGSQFIDLSGDDMNKLDSYETVDIGLIMDVKASWSNNIRLKVDMINILNQKYANNAWSYKYTIENQSNYLQGFYPQALRHAHVSLIASF